MIKNKKILITGSKGFIGSHLYNSLSNENEVSTCDKKDNSDLKYKSIVDALPDVDLVFHLAAYNGTKHFYEKPFDVLEDSTLPTINLLNRYGGKVQKFIYASTCEIYSDAVEDKLTNLPTDESAPVFFKDPANLRWTYAASKYHGELAVHSAFKKFNQTFQILRFNNVYGPGQKDHFIPEFVERAKKGDISLKGWSNTRSFCYISDAIDAVIKLTTCNKADNQIIHIGSGEEISILDCAKKILKILKIDQEIILDDAPEGSVSRRCPDIRKLKSLVDFQAMIPLDKGLKNTLESM